ncbi:MAG TPA: NAD(P)/FAD-dependent oxidoreductase [Thermoanaerobaculia bacterium]|nr:NAD(P)/FAD-dependent oxidoreductase [Thermoanaerobaculia bacterium]
MANYDVLIIGAGAAGLSAARALSGARKRVCLLEARPRVGGRVHTIRESSLPLPIELGAEFVHGTVESTLSLIDAAALNLAQLPDNHWWSADGQWQLVDFWSELAIIQKEASRLKRDMSFADFLRAHPKLPKRLRELAHGFVEGYHAAHADRMSARVLASADSEQEEEAPGANAQYRLPGGYDEVLASLHAALDPTFADVRLNTAVRRVEWSQGRVSVETSRGEALRAAALVITVPIGVLKAPREADGAIAFDPPLREKENALAHIEAGHIVKIAFRFREPFWSDPQFIVERAKDPKSVARGIPLNFVHTNDRFMPTWWTFAPLRAPILTGWAGGHAADALLAEGPETMIDRALDSMSRAFCMKRKKLNALLVGTWTHDWQSDPYARGAYSYATVGGENAHQTMAKPIRRTLFFAGEGTSSDQTGTVAGALESGTRAARDVLRALPVSSRG